MGAGEPITSEDPSPTMEDIFRDLLPEGQQISTTSPEGTKSVDLEVTMAEEVSIDRGQEGVEQVEDSLLEEYPGTPKVLSCSLVLNVSSATKTSSSSHH